MMIIEIFLRQKLVMRIFRLGASNQRNTSQIKKKKKCRLTECCKIFADLQVQMSVFGNCITIYIRWCCIPRKRKIDIAD